MTPTVLLILVLAQAAPGAELTIDQVREQARAARRSFSHQQAIALLEELARREPDRPANFQMLGDEYLSVGRTNDAVAAFETACRLSPADKWARIPLLKIHRETKNWRAFERVAQELVRIAPGDAVSYLYVAEAREAHGDIEGALVQYRQALVVEPTQTQHSIAVGDALVRLGRLKEAEDAYRAAIESLEGDRAHIQLAKLYLRQGRRQDAEREYQALTKTWPESAPALRRLLDENARNTHGMR